MSSTSAASPFDHPLGQTRYDRYAPADVPAALAAAQAEAAAALDTVPGSPDPLAAFGDATARFDYVVRVTGDLAAVLGGGWPEQARAAEQRAAAFRSAALQRADLYEAVRAYRPADPVGARVRADLLHRFETAGAHLDRAGRDRLAAINTRLAELAADFQANLRAAEAAAGVYTDHSDGLPADLVELARAAAAERGLPGWYVPYSDRNAYTVLREARDRDLREGMYRLTVTRAAAANNPVVAEILALRHELATLLGHRDYVTLMSTGRMVPDPQAFLDELVAAYRPQADREYAELLAFARTLEGDPDLVLTAADVDSPMDGYYATRLRESRSLASASGLVVPLDTARDVMFEALGELYGITVAPVTDAAGWHPDVEGYDLRDAAGSHLARVWCDWYARAGKDPGGWMSEHHRAVDGGPQLMWLVTNAPRSGAELIDLRIMWHEFGHCLHYAFARTKYRLGGPDNVPRDFIEGPSRIMENWPLDPVILRRMGVDAAVADAVRAEDRFRTASLRVARAVSPVLDLALHRGEDPVAAKQALLPVPVHPDDATAAHFAHIFAGNYGAGHYAYQWAGVLDADLFTRFATEGILDRAVGREYAATILAPGAERDPRDLVRDFLGRDARLEAALRRDGIAGGG